MQRMLFLACLLCCFSARVFARVAPDDCAKLENFKAGQDINYFLNRKILTCKNDSTQNKMTPFEVAVYGYECHGNPEAVEALLKLRAESTTSLGYSVNSIKDDRTDVSFINIPLWSTITSCCTRKNLFSKSGGDCPKNRKSEIAEILIRYGADVNAFVKTTFKEEDQIANKEGETVSLLDAVRRVPDSYYCKNSTDNSECLKIEKILLDHGAKTYKELQDESATNTVSAEPAVVSIATNDQPVGTNENENADAAQPFEQAVPTTPTLTTVPSEVQTPVMPETTPEPVVIEAVQKTTNNVAQPETEKTINKPTTTVSQKPTNITEPTKKQEDYDAAKAKEQSLANRTMTALATAATGIGGMQLAQGLAEQSADKEAAADMAAYITTMRCTYGDGQQVNAGLEEIELPGGNNQEIMNLRSEYLSLSADLRERKTALGLKPGIESEEILDKSQSGLYDDENVGITGGNYASLYRAQALDSTDDAQQLSSEKSSSKNRVKGGAIAAGAGAVVGVAGTALINGKFDGMVKKDAKDTPTKAPAKK